MRKPTIEEEERFSDVRFGTIRETLVDQTYYELTATEPEWDPQSKRFAQMEDARTDDDGEIVEDASRMNLFSLVISHCYNSKNEEVLLLSRSNDWIAAIRTSKRPGEWNEKLLSKNWGISPELAATTLRKTTRLGVRYFGKTGPKSVSRRFPSGDRPLRYRRLACKIFHDTFFSSIESARGFKCAQIYATDFGWVRVFPMVNKSDVHHTIDDFFHRYGVPESLVSDNAQELTKGQFGFKCRQARCTIGTVIPHSPWQNRAESEIRENKRMTGRWMVKTSTPRRLWCYCSELAAKIRSHTALKIYGLKGEVPESVITGQTADISHLCEFSWYQWIYFNEPTVSYPESKERLGRYLGPCPPGLGSVMTSYVLGDESKVLMRDTIRPLTHEDFESPDTLQRMERFDATMTKKLSTSITEAEVRNEKSTVSSFTAETPKYEAFEDESRMPDVDDFDPETYDDLISCQVTLPNRDSEEVAKVVCRVHDENGVPIGRAHANPILDTRLYKVEFGDGSVKEYAANIIAENLYSQVDGNGCFVVNLDGIVDHKMTKDAITEEDSTFVYKGKTYPRRTTKGWELCVLWKDGSTSWEPLSDLKESYPVDVAEYASNVGIDHLPAFRWWVPFTIKRKERMIKAASKSYHKKQHKFGIELPKSVHQAVLLDKKNGNILWMDALRKEI